MKRTSKLIFILFFLGILFVFNELVLTEIYNSFSLYGSYLYKSQRAASIQEEKYIIAGGSASNLGFSSQKFEELSGKPAVNLSVSAGIPLRVYLKAAEMYAQPGDVIILPLEYGYLTGDYYNIAESYIDMVGIDRKLKCQEENLWKDVEFLWSYFLRSFSKANDCFMFALKQSLGVTNTIYVAKSVDKYGDFAMHKDRTSTYQRTQMRLSGEYDPTVMANIRFFIEKMSERNVAVYITYPPVDGACFENYETVFLEIQKMMEDQIGKKHLIGSPFDFIYEDECFFDTCYHLRYACREMYTEALYTQYKKNGL